MNPIRTKTSHAILWSGLDVFMRQGMQFLVIIILARILAPEDFGLIAILALFTGIAGIFIDSGFSYALIQKKNATMTDESTIFFFNLGMGIIVAVLFCIAAPWIATFFKHPIIQYLTYFMAINLILTALSSIQNTLLLKKLELKIIMQVGVTASVISGLLAIILAWQGFGVWSLAWQIISSSSITVILFWSWHPWRPLWVFDLNSLRSFFRFGGYLMLTGLADTLSKNLVSVIIGKVYSIKDVGYYDYAQRTQQVPINLMMKIVDRVAYSVFSASAEDKELLARGLRKSQIIAMFINIPVMISIIILAPFLVLTLFGQKWISVIPILQVLCIAGILWPVHILNLNVLAAQGKSKLFFNIEIIKKTIFLSLVIIASFHSIIAIVWAQVIASTIAFFINAHYTNLLLNYGAIKQIHDIIPYFIASIPMGLGMWLIFKTVFLPDYLRFLLAIAIGTTLYIMTCHVIRANGLNELILILKQLRLKK